MPNDDSYWTELSIHVMPAVSDIAAEVLQDVTGNGVTILPPVVGLGADEGYIIDPNAPDLLHAYVFGPVTAERRVEILDSLDNAGLKEAIRGEATWGTVRDEDWAEKYKEFYDIEKIGRVVIRPLWREYTAEPGDVVVDMDPGMAFGTGQHPTTRMCIQALQDRMRPGDYVLDLGSGSGILAIAAIALGASRCIATDTEDQAVQMTAENVDHNGMTDRVSKRGPAQSRPWATMAPSTASWPTSTPRGSAPLRRTLPRNSSRAAGSPPRASSMSAQIWRETLCKRQACVSMRRWRLESGVPSSPASSRGAGACHCRATCADVDERVVPRAGLEPATPAFSELCSTN